MLLNFILGEFNLPPFPLKLQSSSKKIYSIANLRLGVKLRLLHTKTFMAARWIVTRLIRILRSSLIILLSINSARFYHYCVAVHLYCIVHVYPSFTRKHIVSLYRYITYIYEIEILSIELHIVTM